MTSDLNAQKAALRHQARQAMQTLTAEQRAGGSLRIVEHLRRQRIWEEASTVLFFAPMPDEPDIWPLLVEALASGKSVALPRFDPKTNVYSAVQVRDLQKDIRAGKFGIREPAEMCAIVPWRQIDLVLVPAVAFDRQGRRLGRGRGFYDRILAEVPGMKCGIAFDEQIVSEVPVSALDVHVNWLVTPTGAIEI